MFNTVRHEKAHVFCLNCAAHAIAPLPTVNYDRLYESLSQNIYTHLSKISTLMCDINVSKVNNFIARHSYYIRRKGGKMMPCRPLFSAMIAMKYN